MLVLASRRNIPCGRLFSCPQPTLGGLRSRPSRRTLPAVILRTAIPRDRATLDRLWLMFRHDLSEFRRVLPAPDGTFRSERLDASFTDPDWRTYVIETEHRPVGLALVRGLVLPPRVISGFFVVRGVRRQGVGLLAVRELVTAYAGPIKVAFQAENAAASRFWRRAATEITPDQWSEERRPVPGRPDLAPDIWITMGAHA